MFLPKKEIGMNIKGMLGNAVSIPVARTERVERTIKSDMSHDRDANGQQTFDQNQKEKQPMSEEQLEKSMQQLRQLSSVKEHHWNVELLIENGKKYVVVKDNLGTIIRRIPEMEMWTLPMDDDLTKGNLLKKTA